MPTIIAKVTTKETDRTSRSQPKVKKRHSASYLIRALECRDPEAGAERIVLSGVTRVEIGRGEREHSRRRSDDVMELRVSLPDRKLSSRHARLSQRGTGWVLTDLDSTNGSWVNGAPVTEHVLSDGDLIELGHSLLLFRQDVECPSTCRDASAATTDRLGGVTLNPDLAHAIDQLDRVAVSTLPVLLLGETGTGKEVMARRVHELSGRPGAFVAVNCGAIPEGLLEAQVFGSMRGAFTGAVRDQLGFVRSAENGTLFLDEVADLPLSAQVALLRVLQDGEIVPVGSSVAQHVDVRVVAATHKDLAPLLQSERFRTDLYARLAGYVMDLPALRDRREDLGWLATQLVRRHAPEREVRFRVEAARRLFLHDWPLNIRELQQCVATALVLATDDSIEEEHVAASIERNSLVPRRSQPPLSSADEALYAELMAVLKETRGNLSETAKRMGKARQQIQRWCRRFQVDLDKYRG